MANATNQYDVIFGLTCLGVLVVLIFCNPLTQINVSNDSWNEVGHEYLINFVVLILPDEREGFEDPFLDLSTI